MSESENFLTRWSRLKRVSTAAKYTDAKRSAEPVPTTNAPPGSALFTDRQPTETLPAAALPVDALHVDALPVGSLPVDALHVDALPVGSLPVDALPIGSLPVGALPVAAVPAGALGPESTFDMASLPSVDSIVADSDIRPFLQPCVPEELTRAALRSTWTADPAIRDFIGIADNQWDFNEPASIPGFGPIGIADIAFSLAARGLGSLNPMVNAASEESGSIAGPAASTTAPDAAPNADPACGEPTGEVQHITTAPPHDPHSLVPIDEISPIIGVEQATRPQIRHSHGGALPK
jgi:hypothetical protein